MSKDDPKDDQKKNSKDNFIKDAFFNTLGFESRGPSDKGNNENLLISAANKENPLALPASSGEIPSSNASIQSNVKVPEVSITKTFSAEEIEKIIYDKNVLKMNNKDLAIKYGIANVKKFFADLNKYWDRHSRSYIDASLIINRKPFYEPAKSKRISLKSVYKKKFPVVLDKFAAQCLGFSLFEKRVTLTEEQIKKKLTPESVYISELIISASSNIVLQMSKLKAEELEVEAIVVENQEN
jgi:hypothetical protein